MTCRLARFGSKYRADTRAEAAVLDAGNVQVLIHRKHAARCPGASRVNHRQGLAGQLELPQTRLPPSPIAMPAATPAL